MDVIIFLFRYQELYGGSTDSLRAEVTQLTKELDKLDSCLVFCHNDLLTGNLIYNKQNGRLYMYMCYLYIIYLLESIALVDFEYAGPNHRAYDIADYFCEYAGQFSITTFIVIIIDNIV